MSALTPSNRAYGRFGLAGARAQHWRRDLSASAFAAVLGLLVALQGMTQWVAHRLAYQDALGAPVAQTVLGPAYAPWSVLVWRPRLSRSSRGREVAEAVDQALGLSALGSFAAAAVTLASRRRKVSNRTAELHGSARWAEREDIEQAGLFDPTGVVVGRWADLVAKRLRWLRSDGPDHVLLFAPTGSGKGVGPVLSTLLTWIHSVVIFDPKGDLFAQTSGWRSTFSRVFRLNFTADPRNATAFNPLAEIRIRTPREVGDVQRIALQLLSPKGDDNTSEAGQYFVRAGADLLVGAILHVLYRESAKGRCATFADVTYELCDPLRTHGQVLEDWLTFAHDPKHEENWVDLGTRTRTVTHPLVAQAARTQRNRSPKDRSPILSTVIAALAVFRDPLLIANTARSDFRIADLVHGGQPLSVYLELRPSDTERLKPLVRLLLDLWVGRLTEDDLGASPPSGAARRRILFLIDEFPLLGKLPSIETALAVARGWGIKFFLVAQDYEQIVSAYGRTESIFSNCGIRAAFCPNKPETARLLSSLVGTTTILKEASSKSGSVGQLFGYRQSLSEQEVKRELLTPDECLRLPAAKKTTGDNPRILEAGDMLVFATSVPAIYAKQALYFQDATLEARSNIAPASARPADIDLPPPDELPPPSPPPAPPLAPADDAELLAAAARHNLLPADPSRGAADDDYPVDAENDEDEEEPDDDEADDDADQEDDA